MQTRSQDLEIKYHDAGQIYWINTKRFLEEKALFMKRTAPYILNPLQVQDIDTEEDWKLAEAKFKLLKNS
jgi:N-acylneuraminate cytidylyltransferase